MISGNFNTAPGISFTLEFFSNATCDPSGFGEAEAFLGSVLGMTDAAGNAAVNFTAPQVAVGSFITATATDSLGNTSELSNCVQVTLANTPTPTPTVTFTPTHTPTSTPIGAGPAIDLGTGVGQPGGIACVPVTLVANGALIAATSNDIGRDPAQISVTGFSINPLIAPGTPANKQLGASTLNPSVQRVTVGGNQNPIPDGVLFTCILPIAAGASIGSHPLSNVPSATDTQGSDITVSGAAGQVLVSSCTGDCNGNGTVSIGEVTRCINLFLGQPVCDSANPTLSCPIADANNSGGVSIGEVTLCVNNFLGGC